MSDEAAEVECECEEGLPPWIATFADMMALLMCFFVLLLSFAEMDAIRFKKMADSLKDAFGVQTEIPTNEIVKGISVVKLEFSASISDPTIVNQIKQETTEEEKDRLEVNDGPKDKSEEESENRESVDQVTMGAVEAAIKAEIEDQAEELRKALKQEIDEKMVTVEVIDSNVIIRINEKGSFPSGSADLHPGFMDVLDRIAVAISTRPGKVIVAGHTDDVPISTERFRSNWELSTARAVTVVHALLTDPTLDPARFLLEGHAESDPLVPNDSFENRALNRRVELIIRRVKDDILEEPVTPKLDDVTENKTTVEPAPVKPIIVPIVDEPQFEVPKIDVEAAIGVEALIPGSDMEKLETPVVAVKVEATNDAEPPIAPVPEVEVINKAEPTIAPILEDGTQKRDVDESPQIDEVITVEDLI